MARNETVDLGAVRAARESLAQVAEQFPDLCHPSPGEDGPSRWERALAANVGSEKPMAPNDAQIVLRLPTDVMEMVDAYAEKLRREQPGMRGTRSDAARVLLMKALEAEGFMKPAKRK